MCLLLLSPNASKFEKKKIKYIYVHHILDGSNIEPQNSENHKHMQVIASHIAYFSYYDLYDLFCNVQIWRHITIHFHIFIL